MDVPSALMQTSDRQWELDITAGWPFSIHLNIYSFDDYSYDNTNGDGVLDLLPPNSLAINFVNTTAPPKPHLWWTLIIDDAATAWSLEPRGYLSISATLYGLLLFIPFLAAFFTALVFMRTRYGIKYNKFDVSSGFWSVGREDDEDRSFRKKIGLPSHKQTEIIGWPEERRKRRRILISMGKLVADVDLIWVIPKVKDLEYPPGKPIEPMEVFIFGKTYPIKVEKHVLDNITCIILDSPVFRAQTKSDSYPTRMDNLSSAISYSTWNRCIAATVKRIPDIDI